jgi:hypothetical protein
MCQILAIDKEQVSLSILSFLTMTIIDLCSCKIFEETYQLAK